LLIYFASAMNETLRYLRVTGYARFVLTQIPR
jgi:hypothetical protein